MLLWPSFGRLGGSFNILGLTLSSGITFMVFWFINIYIIFRGMNSIKIFENYAAPLVLVMAAVLLVWILAKAGGLGPILS
jgi:NCS1 family nucleobase:cation symporter-1